MGTARECEAQGVTYVPMVAETTGAWDPRAAAVLRSLARSAAAITGEAPDAVHALLLQELCVVVRGFRARAVLRRRAEVTP